MNILVCGLTWSGSSAVIDMLKEYDSVGFLPGEFDEFRRPGMVADHIAGRISSLYPTRINDYLKFDKSLIKSAIKLDFRAHRRISALKCLAPTIHDNNVSTTAKLEATRDWVSTLHSIYARNKKHLAIDQPILSGQHFDVWPEALDPFKMLIVYRDPRDQLAQIIKQNHLFLQVGSAVADIYGGDRIGAIKFQIDTLKARLRWFDKIEKRHGADNVAMLSFERFIKQHDSVRNKLEAWLGLEPTPNKNTILDPSYSIKNIGIYKDILTPEEIALLDDLYEDYALRENTNNFYRLRDRGGC